MSEPLIDPVRPGTIRSFLGRLTSLLLVRAELFSIELEEQKIALLRHLQLALTAACLLLITLLCLLLFIVALTPVAWRPIVFGVLAILAAMATGITLWRLKRSLTLAPAPFSQSLSEVRKDCAALLDSKE